MAEAAALVTPSVWYEGFPMTIVEAFAAGLPVIASRLGAMAEVISHEQNGLHFTPGDVLDLAGTVRHAFAESERLPQMGRAARRTYERLYTPERNLALLEKIYAEAIEEAQRSILCHA
jgi:glycosyltransferase involved in cell wall biosynthesis